MADVVTFDPANLRIVEIDAGGDNELDIIEVYSEWKDWLLADFQRMGFPPAFRVVGGDPISGTQSLGSTFFLINGWRIRPAESDHRLVLNGNLFTDPAGDSVVVPTLGAFTVTVEMATSNLIDQVSSTGSDPATIADAVWDELASGHVAAGSLGRLLADTPENVWDQTTIGHVAAGSFGGLLAQADLKVLEVFRMLGMDAAVAVEHGATYIRVPPDGTGINIQVIRTGDKTILQRL